MDGGRVAFWPSMRSLSSGWQSSIATSPIALPNSSLGSRGECSPSGRRQHWESSGPPSQWSLSCCVNKLRDFVLSVMRRRGNAAAWGGVVLATLAILVATLHAGGTKIAPGWSFSITSGDAALAELIQNLLLFIPLGLSLTLAGVRPLRVVAIGALLSFAVEFAQQWIPGRDPSVGDIVCNSISTALGVALVLFAPQWLTTAPRRSAWQALATAVAAVLVWIGTGAMLRQSFPPPPYHTANAPELNSWGRYQGQVLWSSFAIGALSVRATAPSRPPRRTARRGARPAQRRAVHPRHGRPRSLAELPHAGDPLDAGGPRPALARRLRQRCARRHLHRGDVVRRQTDLPGIERRETLRLRLHRGRRLEADLRSGALARRRAYDDQCPVGRGVRDRCGMVGG